MFNSTLKKAALEIHEKELKRYNETYEIMQEVCAQLYETRSKSIEMIKFVEKVVNSIANTPKEIDTQLGKIGKELIKFNETEKYAKEAYDESKKAGVNIAGGAAAGVGIASMAPTVLTSIATTFGTASTGTAISALSGAAAQKATVAWIGRTFAKFAVKEGAGMAAGQAFLALAGPVGWGITAVSTGFSLISLTNKNKEISDKAVKEAKEIRKAREALEETNKKIEALKTKTMLLLNDLIHQKDKIAGFMNMDYRTSKEENRLFLGALVNNTLSLSVLLNETIE